MNEIWKDIPLFDNYQASNYGEIKNKITNKILKKYLHVKKNGYKSFTVSINSKTYRVSRLILCAFDRLPNKNEECDHINRNPIDNRIENLRWVTSGENKLNRNNYGKSKYKGVSFCSHNYKLKDGSIKTSCVIRAQITINKQRIKLGNFKTEIEAHEAYKIAFKKYRGYEWVD